MQIEGVVEFRRDASAVDGAAGFGGGVRTGGAGGNGVGAKDRWGTDALGGTVD